MKAYICENCAFCTIIKNRFEKCPICNNEFAQLTNKESKVFLNLNGDQRIQWIENKIGHSIDDELNLKRKRYIERKKCGEPTTNEGKFISGYYYCKKCGRVVFKIADKTGYINDTCDYCKSKLFFVPEKYWRDGKSTSIKNEQVELLREELVKASPEFDEYLFTHRDSDLQQRWSEINAALEHGKAILEEQSRVPKCPSCGSSNISKIGIINRAVSTSILGLASSKIGKTHKCNNCGSTW